MMEDRNLQKWALVAEIVGGAAVILSLIFVGLEISQTNEETALNTRAIEVGAYQDLINQMNSMNMQLFVNPELAELYRQLINNEIPVDETDTTQIRSFISYSSRHSDMAFLQFENSLITEDQLFSVMIPLRQILRTEFGRNDWSQRTSLRDEFRAYVKDQMAIDRPDEAFWK